MSTSERSNAHVIAILIAAAIVVAVTVSYFYNYYLDYSVNVESDCVLDRAAIMNSRAEGQYEVSLVLMENYKSCNDQKNNTRYGMAYYFHLGWTYHEMGRYEDAVLAYTDGIPQQPEYPYVYYRRALSAERLDDAGMKALADDDMHHFYKLAVDYDAKQFSKTLDDYPDIRVKLAEYGIRH